MQRLRPGETLTIEAGTYILAEWDDALVPPSGTAAAPVTIRGAPGERVVLAGRNGLGALIRLVGVSHLRLENLELTHDAAAAGEAAWCRDGIVAAEGVCRDVVLRDLYVHHLDEFGLNVQDADGLQVVDCRFEYCGFGAIGGPEGAQGGLRNVAIRNCSLSWSGHYYQGTDGTGRPYDRPDGFGSEPSDGPVLIEDTTAEHNYGDGLDSKCRSTTIRRCTVANNTCDGVKLWGGGSRIENTLIYGRGDGYPEHSPWAAVVIDAEERDARFELVNCTIDDQLGNNYAMYAQYDTPDVPIELVLRNTIISSRGPRSAIFLGRASHLVAEHCLFWFPNCEVVYQHRDRDHGPGDVAGLGPGCRYGDPRFVRPAWGEEGDYHLQDGSPATDVAGDGWPDDDLTGARRPVGDGADIGCYER